MLNISFLAQTATIEADSMPAGTLVQFDKDLLIKIAIQAFNVLLLTAILILLLHKPVKKFMNDRAGKIKNDIDSARRNNQEAEELKMKYQELINNIEKEREEILNQANRAAVEKSDQILFAAHEEAKYLLIKAENEIKMERENAADDIKMQIIELSTFIASRFVEVSIDKQTQDKYIEEALADWSEYTWQI
jgi:F-type H+-transporting ATPase subunit b